MFPLQNLAHKELIIKPSGAGPVHLQNSNVVITVPADALALYISGLSAGTVLAEKKNTYVSLHVFWTANYLVSPWWTVWHIL